MTINRNNYQEYFLDYFEHALEPGQVAELMVFLEANPDLNNEFEAFEPVSLAEPAIPFERKDQLKKKEYKAAGRISATNYEEWMIGRLERDLSASGERELDRFLELNPNARLEYAHFVNSRLSQPAEVYKNKAALKKRAGVVLFFSPLNTLLAVAATVLLMLAIYLLNDRQPKSEQLVRNPVLEKQQPLEMDVPTMEALPAELATLKPVPQQIGHRETSVQDRNTIALLPTMQARRASPLALSQNKTQPADLVAMRPVGPAGRPAAGEVPVDREPSRSFASRFFAGVFTNVFGERESTPEKKTMLEYTIDGYNLLADRDVEVEKAYNAEGKVISYHVNGETIKIGRRANTALQE